MRIPVLIRTPPLRARYEATGRVDFHGLASQIETSGRLQLDPSFTPIPLDKAGEPFTPAPPRRHVFRASVEATSLEEVPARIGDAEIFSDPPIGTFACTCLSSPAQGDAAAVRRALGVTALGARGLTGSGVAVAIMDGGIDGASLARALRFQPLFDVGNSFTPPHGTQPFQYSSVHGTMCAFDALLAAPQATLLDFPVLASPRPAPTPFLQHLSTVYDGYRELSKRWGLWSPNGLRARYSSLVVVNSWGLYNPSHGDFPPGHCGRYCDNPKHVFNKYVAGLSRSGIDIVFAAGNCGDSCPYGDCAGRTAESIMGANALPEVLTIAGCDVSGQRVGYSSKGPSIVGMYEAKPDVAAYTHFLGLNGNGPGRLPDTGTSAAAPVAAGCIAALRTRLPSQQLAPHALFDVVRWSASNGRWSPDLGYGIIRPMAAACALGL